jgi:hypothetical protein
MRVYNPQAHFGECDHMWVADPGPQTDKSHAMAKEFIARQLAKLRKAA